MTCGEYGAKREQLVVSSRLACVCRLRREEERREGRKREKVRKGGRRK